MTTHNEGTIVLAIRGTLNATGSEMLSFSLPSPKAKTERFIGTVRGVVTSREEMRAAMDATVRRSIAQPPIASLWKQPAGAWVEW